MSSRKYRKDYRLIEHVDERGRITTDSVYCGEVYRFSEGTEKAHAALKRMRVWTVIGSGCFIASLTPYSTASRTMIVMIPYLFSALPLWMLLSSIVRLLKKKEELEQKDADFANDRIPACSLWLLVLPGIAFASEVCTIFLKPQSVLNGDIVFLAGAALLIVSACICFSRRKNVMAEKESLLFAEDQQ
ncbi:MAG: hypothetical protein IKT07_12125 [Oscillospiraceae bacterium]|nr:hypothetical protein [Oscillospiraceae bacterium]